MERPFPSQSAKALRAEKQQLALPVIEPRAEDILVFSCAVEPGTWMEIKIARGTPVDASALTMDSGRIIVAYPGLQVVIDEATGKLLSFEHKGYSVFKAPMTYAFRRRGANGRLLHRVSVDLVASSSTPAMTEVHFVITVDSSTCRWR